MALFLGKQTIPNRSNETSADCLLILKFVYDPHLSQWVDGLIRDFQESHNRRAPLEEEEQEPILNSPYESRQTAHSTSHDISRSHKQSDRSTSFFGASGDYELRRRGRQEPALPQEEQWIRAEMQRSEREKGMMGIEFGVGQDDPFRDEKRVDRADVSSGDKRTDSKLLDTWKEQSTTSKSSPRGAQEKVEQEHNLLDSFPSGSSRIDDPLSHTSPSGSNIKRPIIENTQLLIDLTPRQPTQASIPNPSPASAPEFSDTVSLSTWTTSLADLNAPHSSSQSGSQTSAEAQVVTSEGIASPLRFASPLSQPSSAAGLRSPEAVEYGVMSLSSVQSTSSDGRRGSLNGLEQFVMIQSEGRDQSGSGVEGSRRGSGGSDSGWTDAEVRSDN